MKFELYIRIHIYKYIIFILRSFTLGPNSIINF
jgi:hypothetical protein